MKKLSLTQRLFQNNYALLVLALVVSFGIWVYMSMNSVNDTNVTISNLPIQTELSDSAKELGLQVFSGDTTTASVTLSGNRTMLGQITESDLIVTASASSVSTTGNYTLPVSATKANPSSNFQIVSNTPSSINVVVDYFKEGTFTIQDGLEYGVKNGYYGSTSMPYKELKISGPQSEVMKIKKVVAKGTIEGELTEDKEVVAQIVLYDENNNELPQKLLTLSFTTMDVKVEVMPEKTVPLKPVFINKPAGLNITEDMITINPSSILLAGPKDVIDNVKAVNIEAIDFSTLKNDVAKFDALSFDVLDSCKNISDNNTVSVTLDLSSMSVKQFDVETFSVEGLPSKYKSEVTSKSVTVTVVGPKSEIDALTADKITAVIDTTDANGKTGSVQMPVSFKFSSATSCWAYGKYQANLTITES